MLGFIGGGIGGWELLLIFMIVLLVFGAKRLPEIARSLGKATTEFKKAKNELSNMANDVTSEDVAPRPATPAPKQDSVAKEPLPTKSADSQS